MEIDDQLLTDADMEAINLAEEQMDRGEYVDFGTFAAEMRKKYCETTLDEPQP